MVGKLGDVNEQLIEQVFPEIRDALVGLSLREIFQLGDDRFAIAFEGEEIRLLFVAIEATEPRIYLIKRRLRDLKKIKQNQSKFAVDAERFLKRSRIINISKYNEERVIEFCFESAEIRFFIAQLTGTSSNLFLLDSDRKIVAAAKKPAEGEQSLGMQYSIPDRPDAAKDRIEHERSIRVEHGPLLSESLDAYFLQLDADAAFSSLAKAARKKNLKTQAKFRRLIKNLENDTLQHGDPALWKKYGDLLLANQSNAKREGGWLLVRDLFHEGAPIIAIEMDENDSIPDAAQKYFRKYAKARNAAAEIASRIASVQSDLERAESEAERIEIAIRSRNADLLSNYAGEAKTPAAKGKHKRETRLPPGIRSFVSSDGFEILVGKKATDNDHLTFRIASSRDIWMHAADYPGSHVVIRNNDRKEVPQRTMIEAAQLAAFYSQGKKQTKAAVNYTEKKFVDKPKGAAPGLVRLASFRTILVEPVFPNVSEN